MTTLSASIMAHPDRQTYVDELLGALGHEDIPVSWDVNPLPSSDGDQRWSVGRGAWKAHDGADWACVLQDDAVVCSDFLAGFARALEHLPDDALVASAYCGTKRPGQVPFTRIAREARSNGASWLRSLRLWWGVAVAVRTDMIDGMLAWCDDRTGAPYDSRIGTYFEREVGVDCWYTWPSLTDHREGPSLIAHRDEGRHAREFVGTDASALDLRWDGPVVHDPRLRQRDLLRERMAARA